MSSNDFDPNGWQIIEPDHAKVIAEAVDNLCAAINSLFNSSREPLVEQAAIRWSIEQLEAFGRAELEAEIDLGWFHDPGDDSR